MTEHVENRKFVEDALKAHNEYRQRHKVAPLKLNRDVTGKAQKWAEHLASTGSFQHSSDRSHGGDSMGENIAMKWTSGGADFTGQQVTNQWYSEVSKYNYSHGGGSGTGHFTQVVWKDSREFGIGRARGRDGKWIVVGNYVPAGNFMGRYQENVFSPKDGKTSLIGDDAPSTAGAPSKSGFDSGRNQNMASSGNSSSGGGRVVSRQTKTVTEGCGANKKTRTIVTETIVEPDGSRKTVTNETVTTGN